MGKAKFVLGAILGAAAAALLTPVNGRKAREKLIKMGEDLGIDPDEVKKKVEDLARESGVIIQEALSGRKRAAAPKKSVRRKTNGKNK